MIGITASVPVEIVFASGRTPVDLNNRFITHAHPERLIAQAEAAGFSHSVCAWIKGIYGAVRSGDVGEIIAVTGGDCSYTIALAEVLEREGVAVIPFEYPLRRDAGVLRDRMEEFRRTLGASWDAVRDVKARLDRIRAKLDRLDRLTFEEDVITGEENHRFLVNASDFEGDPDRFERRLDRLLDEAAARPPRTGEIRLGYLGVPPAFTGLHPFVEEHGARVVFNEVQRQFGMPHRGRDMVEQYLAYTYPYDAAGRVRDIREAVEVRRLDGLIHYIQTFCYRGIYDILFKKDLGVPILTLEGDRPGPVDGRTALRVETFIHMLEQEKP